MKTTSVTTSITCGRPAVDACHFVEGLGKEDFLADKRTQQAVIDADDKGCND